jgi:UDP-glucose-4-epimerase GalE
MRAMKRILVTGGAGYIGSHTVRELARSGYAPVTPDNLSEGYRAAVIEGEFEESDLNDEGFLEGLFNRYRFDAVMHFASRCYVGESVTIPQRYCEENIGNALTLFRVMLRNKVKRFVFSSTCATYGAPIRVPIDEAHPQAPVNLYGETKFLIEKILRQYDRAYDFGFVSLRYFNGAGASRDGLIGESHVPETHLIPRILSVASGGLNRLVVYGDDHATEDGTCVRDYIHGEDLASAHVAALKWMEAENPSAFFNLGTGEGYSVFQLVETGRRETGAEIALEIGPRRPGDPPALVADPDKASRDLGWNPRHSDLETIVRTA